MKTILLLLAALCTINTYYIAIALLEDYECDSLWALAALAVVLWVWKTLYVKITGEIK